MTPKPELTSGAQALYDRLGPLESHDEENDWAGAHRCQAIALMWQGLDEIILDSDTHPGWTIILDPEDEPEAWLPWTAAAIYGVTLVPGSTMGERRARIRELPPQGRGGVEALRAAVLQTLAGTKKANFFERAGSPYRELVVANLADTPSEAATLAAVVGQKIAGVKQKLVVTATWLIAELERTYRAKTVAELEAAFVSAHTVETHGVI